LAALEAPREVFLFFISAAKDKAPLAARALQQRVDAHPWIA
jgi:lipase chaperone LimK